MYFLLLMLKSGQKRSALQPQTIYSEVPYIKVRSGISYRSANSYKCRTRSLISWVLPWFQNWVPM